MRKAYTVTFVSIVFLFLSGVLVARFSLIAGFQAPEWLDVGKTHSALEGRAYTMQPDLNVDSILSGEYQSQTEKSLSDGVPMRQVVVFSNALMQRQCVELANCLAGYKCIPTLLNTYVLQDPSIGCLLERPLRQTDSTASNLEYYANGVADIAKQFPDKRFLVFVVDASMTSQSNPSIPLLSSHWTTDSTVDLFKNCLSGSPNVAVETVMYDSANDYYSDFFKTDLHWNIRGASRAYNQIADTLELERFDPMPLTSVEGPQFIGFYGRMGRIPLSDDVFDTSFDFRDLSIIDNAGNATDESWAHSAYYNSSLEEQRWSFHDLYYGRKDASPRIEGPGEGSAVLISDSYGFAIKRLLAMNYATLYTDCDLHGESMSNDLTLISRISREDVRDVIFIARTNNYESMKKRLPAYFNY